MALVSLLLLAALLPNLGRSASVDVGIINGTEARPHSRPYMVSIQDCRGHICGGFLVSNKFVMTAAHCWEEGQILTAVLGAHDLSDPRDGSIRMKVASYHVHPCYKFPDYDIMLLKLRGKAKRSQTVNWIPIPQTAQDIPANTVCSVPGWGQTGTYRPISRRLMETHVTIIDTTCCSQKWYPTPITARMVCALHPGGTCMGDSGGPLVCGSTAVGIVSFVETGNCDKPNFPNGYSKISAFLPWIKSIIGKDSPNEQKRIAHLITL